MRCRQICIFCGVLRSDAEDEEYDHLVQKWIHGYNAYSRLGSALDATVGPLVTNWRKAGEFPADIGIDALRAWAFVVYRDHHHTCGEEPDTLLVCHPEVTLILEAIRDNPTAGIDDLPPLPPSRQMVEEGKQFEEGKRNE